MRLKSIAVAMAGIMLASGAAAQTATPAVAVPAQIAPPALTPENSWHLDLSNGGRVTIQLRPDAAPDHVERIRTLTRQGFYDGVIFHRVIEGFMAQGGDPTGTGEGGSELPDLKAEFNKLPHVRGAVSAARTSEPDTANSQFFIMFTPRLALDEKYSVFGRVVDGMEHVDGIQRGSGDNGEVVANPTRIVRASIGADNVAPPTAAEVAAAAQPAAGHVPPVAFPPGEAAAPTSASEATPQ